MLCYLSFVGYYSLDCIDSCKYRKWYVLLFEVSLLRVGTLEYARGSHLWRAQSGMTQEVSKSCGMLVIIFISFSHQKMIINKQLKTPLKQLIVILLKLFLWSFQL